MVDYQKRPEKIVVKVDPDLEDLIPGFMDNRHRDITNILEALQERNFEKIRILGHTLKGAGGGYGFEGISEIGRQIEQAAENEEADDIKEQVARLQIYLDVVQVVSE